VSADTLARPVFICYQIMMKQSIPDSKKSRGRPTTGIGKSIGLRLYPELETAIQKYEKAQKTQVSRPEAIRQILTDYLRRRGFFVKEGE
jgi:hypothetical protein